MNVLFDNVNLSSSSGPNGFARKLLASLKSDHGVIATPFVKTDDKFDVQLSFIVANCKVAPIVQRLDGIYFNSDQDFRGLNSPIYETYKLADSVVFQSNFNKMLTESYFGKHEDPHIIYNGTNKEEILKITPLAIPQLEDYDEVWSCASSWRPHKRLKDNIQYFLDFAPQNACLVIAGENPDVKIANPRIFYSGQLSWQELIGLFRLSKTFIHLAWLDHCPNVVVDARAAGCDIVCSSAGGTREIAGKDATIIVEDDWNFSPVKLYSPPDLDFSKSVINDIDNQIDISISAAKYLEIFENFLP